MVTKRLDGKAFGLTVPSARVCFRMPAGFEYVRFG